MDDSLLTMTAIRSGRSFILDSIVADIFAFDKIYAQSLGKLEPRSTHAAVTRSVVF
jgi:hypothetical protein